ncbi:MAG: hypothetical protein WC770_06835 [Phycisphaerae bacterium]|jgi:hypothetical protein
MKIENLWNRHPSSPKKNRVGYPFDCSTVLTAGKLRTGEPTLRDKQNLVGNGFWNSKKQAKLVQKMELETKK